MAQVGRDGAGTVGAGRLEASDSASPARIPSDSVSLSTSETVDEGTGGSVGAIAAPPCPVDPDGFHPPLLFGLGDGGGDIASGIHAPLAA